MKYNELTHETFLERDQDLVKSNEDIFEIEDKKSVEEEFQGFDLQQLILPTLLLAHVSLIHTELVFSSDRLKLDSRVDIQGDDHEVSSRYSSMFYVLHKSDDLLLPRRTRPKHLLPSKTAFPLVKLILWTVNQILQL